MNEYDALIESCRACASGFNTNCDRCMFCRKDNLGKFCHERLHEAAADAIEELSRRIDRAVDLYNRNLYNRNVEKTAMYEALIGLSPEPPKEET